MASPFRVRDREQPAPMGKIAALSAAKAFVPSAKSPLPGIIQAWQPPDGLPQFTRRSIVPQLSTFNPTSLITGAGGFWRADAGVTGNPNVTAWADQSSFANNLVTTNNPQFSSTGWLSAFPGITFSGSNVAYSTSFTFSASTTVSFFALFSTSAASANGRVISYALQTTDYATNGQFCLVEQSSSTLYNTYQLTVPYSCGDPGSFGVAVLVGGVFDGANFTGWKNAVTQGTGANTTTFLANQNIGFGADVSSGAGDYAKGTVAFWGITQKVMNSTDWTNLKNYSNSNWGTSL